MKYISLCVLVLFFFFNIFLATSHGMWDLSSLTRDQIHDPALEAQNADHWAAREVLVHYSLNK